jgi:short-subunit dehydrogenase
MSRALVTGASSGIGAVYADRLARRGYDLVLIGRDASRLGAVANTISRDTGRKVEPIVADLASRPDQLKIEERLRADASISALVNNAGLGAAGPLLASDVDQLDTMIQVNVTALTRLVHAAAPGFVARGTGAIINIASIVALAPELLNGVYSGTKAYVVNLTQSLHNEVGSKGVRVQAVLPGAIETAFWDRAGLPVTNLPSDWVMSADELVDAALAGFDQGEVITIPSLPDVKDWERLDAARKALGPGLSRKHAAERYRQ